MSFYEELEELESDLRWQGGLEEDETLGFEFMENICTPYRWSASGCVINAFSLYNEESKVKPGMYGKKFLGSMDGKAYILRGVNLKAPKYPIIAEREDGKRFKFTLEGVGTVLSA